MIEVHRVTHASPEAVWRVLPDGWLHPVWVVGASRMRDVEAAWPQVGARLHHSFGVWPAVVDDTTEVLESEPGHRLRLQARGWPAGEATVEIVLDPLPDGGADAGVGCRITIREDATAGPGRFVPYPLRAAALLPRNTETVRRLALVAEGRGLAGHHDHAPHSGTERTTQ